MTDSQLAEGLLKAMMRKDWPRLAPNVVIDVKLRSGGARGLRFFAAREITGQRVKIEWHLSPWEKDAFRFAAAEAFRAANEILRGLTAATTVSH